MIEKYILSYDFSFPYTVLRIGTGVSFISKNTQFHMGKVPTVAYELDDRILSYCIYRDEVQRKIYNIIVE